MKRILLYGWLLLSAGPNFFAQQFSFDFANHGRRVCLVETIVNPILGEAEIRFLDAADNTEYSTSVYRRRLNAPGNAWQALALDLPAGTSSYIDRNLGTGQAWEYQVRRKDTWQYAAFTYDAIGYTAGAMLLDRTNPQGQLILLVAEDVVQNLPSEYERLKRELTADGWWVKELIVARASDWDSGETVSEIRSRIQDIYQDAPTDDKPRQLFILGHVALPRCGASEVAAPDQHNENKGARGCDAYYADIDGVFTDTVTFDPGNLVDPLLVNRPGDYKWDQDFLPSEVELAFGRVDFADLTDLAGEEMDLLRSYLNRLSNYRNVAPGFDMGNRTAFFQGFDNSNDGSYRSLPNISGAAGVLQNVAGANHPQWVKEQGPFQMYMQNRSVPEVVDWETYGMEATVFSSDQSYWGFGDLPQGQSVYSRIRALLGVESKCLVTLWTTTGLNIFHQLGTGMNLGESLREIINHNRENQKLEKPPQDFDTPQWWNRTHFAYYGDPSLRLYQVAPVADLKIEAGAIGARLSWSASPDAAIEGYHLYRSASEWGPFEKITATVQTGLSYEDPDYQVGDWYLVKAVAIESTGAGLFYNPSLGRLIQGQFSVTTHNLSSINSFKIFPQPTSDHLFVETDAPWQSLSLSSITGQLLEYWPGSGRTRQKLELGHYPAGIYLLTIEQKEGLQYQKIILE